MLADPRRLVGKASERFKRRVWGPRFRCPVCHFELAFADADGRGLVVCPVCGAVIEIDAPYGHPVPVVHDVEIQRPQPKARIHPTATHLPIGLFPFAAAGALVLFLGSVATSIRGGPPPSFASDARLFGDVVLVLLVLSVGASLVTAASGLWDWSVRYRRRPYRQIQLKIACSVVFVVVGAAAVALHASGAVFSGADGLMKLGSLAGIAAAAAYLSALGVGMVALATLGHVGGNLVFGR